MDRLVLSLALWEKSSNFTHTIRVKDEFRQNLCTTDFLVALSVESPWMLSLFSLKQRKFTGRNLKTPSRSQVGSKTLSISSCHSNSI